MGAAPWGRRSSRASTRARAAARRDLSESRSCVSDFTCSASRALVRRNSSWRTSKRSTRSAIWSMGEAWSMAPIVVGLGKRCAPAYNGGVGARAVVHMAQFNGKQEGRRHTANLTCAAPATVSGRTDPGSGSIMATERLEHALGKAMEFVPPARIPANTVVVRASHSRDVHALSGKTARAPVSGSTFYENSIFSCALWRGRGVWRVGFFLFRGRAGRRWTSGFAGGRGDCE